MRGRCSFVPVLSRRGVLSEHPYMHKIENGADAGLNGHHMLHGPPHGALHVLALVNNGARLSEMAIPSPQHKSQEEAVDLTLYWPETETLFPRGALLGQRLRYRGRSDFWGFPESETSAVIARCSTLPKVHINRVSTFERMSIFDTQDLTPK